jgi:hypothetical protein
MPKTLNQVIHYKTFLISPEEVVVFWWSVGSGYSMSDRLSAEQKLTFKQIVKPGAFNEPDPAKRLAMFSVEVRVEGRMNILKSFGITTNAVKSISQRQMKNYVDLSFTGLDQELALTMKERLKFLQDNSQAGLSPEENAEPTHEQSEEFPLPNE